MIAIIIIMLTHTLVNDGSWELRIFVTDLKVEKRLRVKGDMHIGGVILKLVEELGKWLISLPLYHLAVIYLAICPTDWLICDQCESQSKLMNNNQTIKWAIKCLPIDNKIKTTIKYLLSIGPEGNRAK